MGRQTTRVGPRLLGTGDSIWLRMDRDTNPLVIDSVLWFDRKVPEDALFEALEERLVQRYPVFRQKAVEPPLHLGMPFWDDDPLFSIGRHLTVLRLPAPGGQAELAAYLEQQMSQQLPRDRPLWQAHLLHGYHRGSAVMLRFHHAIADGVALMRVLLDLTDPTPDGQPDTTEDRRHPTGPVPAVTLLSRTSPQKILTVGSKLLLSHNPDTALRVRPGVAKRAVWSREHSLDVVKSVAKAAQATVNDVLLTALAGALGEYLGRHPVGPSGDGADSLTTMVPVNLRSATEPLPQTLGNKFALVYLPLPTGGLTPMERLARTKQVMDDIKHSPEAAMTFGLMSAIGLTASVVERVVVDFFSGKAIGVTTNVPGPRSPRYLAGRKLTGVLGWVPSAGPQTVGVCIITYNSTVRIGFRLDAQLPEPEFFVEAFERALADLEQAG